MKILTSIPARSLLLAVVLSGVPCMADAQWSRTYEQMYLPGDFNFTFRRDYPGADRLFNAFDYGHAILYERLLNEPEAGPRVLEVDEYDFVTRTLLVNPPRLPLEEAAIEVNYARLAPEAKMMFDWAHLLHRQIYDVLAMESWTPAEKDAKVAQLLAYYKTRPDLAFSSLPKNMDLMEAQSYSLAFRQRYPKFNGLIWGYHWLQVGLYEPLLVGRTPSERQSGVTAAVARFRQMLENAPERMPRVMPMTAAIAPTFAERYPEAAIIFDNLHSMHDVVSDILANNERVPRSGKRAAIIEAAARYRDSTSYLMTMAEWRAMGTMTGVENMGGPAVGVMTAWATPTIPRGATMAEAMRLMPGHVHGGAAPASSTAAPADAHAGHAMPAAPAADTAHAGMNHGAMTHGADTSHAAMMALHERMLRDPVIHARVMADTALRRMVERTGHVMPATSGAAPASDPHAGHDMSAGAATRAPRAAARPAARKASARKAAPARRGTTARKVAPPRKPASVPKARTSPPPVDHSKMGHSMPPKTP